MRIKYFAHFHRPFPRPVNSSWVFPTIYEDKPGLVDGAICLSRFDPCIRSIFPGGDQLDQDRIGYLSQTIAAEFWILHHVSDADYVGVTAYRRYPYIMHDKTNTTPGIFAGPASAEVLTLLTGDHNLSIIENVLQVYDAIGVRKAYCRGSVKSQFLETQRVDVWEIFIQSIADVVPEYRKWLGWFEIENFSYFCGPMGLMPLSIFKEYSDIFIKIVSSMLTKVENPFLCLDPASPVRTDRWIGYLSERFYPFFVFVNRVKVYEVPMILLNDVRRA
jgi:hypothetical protein